MPQTGICIVKFHLMLFFNHFKIRVPILTSEQISLVSAPTFFGPTSFSQSPRRCVPAPVDLVDVICFK